MIIFLCIIMYKHSAFLKVNEYKLGRLYIFCFRKIYDWTRPRVAEENLRE